MLLLSASVERFSVFTESAPTGRFSHRAAITVCLFAQDLFKKPKKKTKTKKKDLVGTPHQNFFLRPPPKFYFRPQKKLNWTFPPKKSLDPLNKTKKNCQKKWCYYPH